MKRVIMLMAVLAMAASANAAPKKVKRHALYKVAAASVGVVTKAPNVAVKGVKYTLGSVVFAVEAGNDVALLGLTALDKAASMELKHNPFHYAAVVDGKFDAGLEYASEYFFGYQNP